MTFRWLRAKTVRADEVREGQFIEWPENTGIIRRVDEASPPSTDGEGRCYVAYWNGYDGYEYELLDSQPVTVWEVVA